MTVFVHDMMRFYGCLMAAGVPAEEAARVFSELFDGGGFVSFTADHVMVPALKNQFGWPREFVGRVIAGLPCP